MASFALHEATRYSIVINKPTHTFMSWGKSPLSIHTDRGMDVFEFSHNIIDYTKTMQFNVTNVNCPKYVPCKRFFMPDLFDEIISNQEYVRCFLEPSLWAHNEDVAKKVTRIYKHDWIELNKPLDKSNILVTLTNTGSVDFYKSSRYGYINILNLTSVLEDKYDHLKETDLLNIECVSRVCKKILSTSICSGTVNNDENKYFVTSQRNGSIIFWILKVSKDLFLTATFCDELICGDEEIINMLWITVYDTVCLICSFLNGIVTGYHCRILNGKIEVIQEIYLWKFQDKMPMQFVKFKKVKDDILLVFAKHRHLVIQLLDSQLTVVNTFVQNIDDYKIVGIFEYNNNFVVGTFNCQLYLINVNISDSKILVTQTKINVMSSYTRNCFLEGFDLSQNKVIWSFIVTSKKLEGRKVTKELSVLFLHAGETDETDINLLLRNPSENLMCMSDCIELLKFKANKYRILPNINYNLLYMESNDNLYKLRVYFLLVVLYKNRIIFSTKRAKYKFPETSIEKVRDTIFMKHSLNIILNIQSVNNEKKALTESLKEVYFGCKNTLIQYCDKYKKDIKNIYVEEVNVDDFQYTCQCCDEMLSGFTCKNNHINQFCSVTFTPISNDKYLECKYCGLTARYDLLPENPNCTLCDSFLNDCYLPT